MKFAEESSLCFETPGHPPSQKQVSNLVQALLAEFFLDCDNNLKTRFKCFARVFKAHLSENNKASWQ